MMPERCENVCPHHSRIEALLEDNRNAIANFANAFHEILDRLARLEELMKNQNAAFQELADLRRELEEKTEKGFERFERDFTNANARLSQRIDALESKVDRFEGALSLLRILVGILIALATPGFALMLKNILKIILR